MSYQATGVRGSLIRSSQPLILAALLGLSGCGSEGGSSPPDRLDADRIPAEERSADQPAELVAVLVPAPANDPDRVSARAAALAFHPGGRWLLSTHRAAEAYRYTRVWDLRSGRKVHETMIDDNRLRGLAFAPDGKSLACVSEIMPVVVVADFQDGKVTQRPARPITKDGHQLYTVASAAFAPDGRTLASGGFDRSLRLWDATEEAPTLKVAVKLPGGVNALAFSADGKTLWGACSDKCVRSWDVTVSPPRETVKLDHDGGVETLSLSADGQLLAAGCGDKKIWLWDLGRQPAPIKTKLEGHPAVPNAVTFSPNGRLIASSDTSANLIIWNADGKKLREIVGCDRPAFAPDGKHLAVAARRNAIYILRLPDGS